VVGAFPRWISLGQVSNPKNASMGETGAFIAYGVRFYFKNIVGSTKREGSRSCQWILRAFDEQVRCYGLKRNS